MQIDASQFNITSIGPTHGRAGWFYRIAVPRGQSGVTHYCQRFSPVQRTFSEWYPAGGRWSYYEQRVLGLTVDEWRVKLALRNTAP